MIIFARHGETPANAARESGSADSRVQGFSKEMPLSEVGERQALVFGDALRHFLRDHDVVRLGVHSSDAVRAERTRDLVVGRLAMPVGALTLMTPDTRLRELSKGSLEGVLRTEAYPTDEIRKRQKTDWHFRHGTIEGGGETAYEAGRRWLGWVQETYRPDEHNLVVGHNLATSFGTWMLTHAEQVQVNELPSLEESVQYKVGNGTALVIDEHDGAWQVVDRIIPIK